MKKSEYLKKIVNRTEDLLVSEGLSDEYTIYWDVEKIDGVKHPIMTLESPESIEHRYDLLEQYNRHEEEDISMSESFRSFKNEVIEFIRGREDEMIYGEEDFDEEEIEYEDIDTERIGRQFLGDHLKMSLCNADIFAEMVGNPDLYFHKNIQDMVVYFVLDWQDRPLTLETKYSVLSDYSNADIDQYIDICLSKLERNHNPYQMEMIDPKTVSLDPCSILSEHAMESIKNMLESDSFYIIPVCDTEILAVKDDDQISDSLVQNTLTRSNGLLYDSQKLSDFAFRYDTNTKELVPLEEEVRVVLAPSAQAPTESHENHESHEEEPEHEEEQEDQEEYEDEDYGDDEYDDYDYDDDDYDEDEEGCHDSDYFANYDTNSPDEFANTMVELFNYRLGNNFHLSGSDLVDSEDLVHINMEEANNDYQTNSLDFLEYGDTLVSKYQEQRDSLFSSEMEEPEKEDHGEEESYPDDYLPF